jgi:hypothetical protein
MAITVSDLVGDWEMNHDNWKGVLSLTSIGEENTIEEGRCSYTTVLFSGTWTGVSGASHPVSGELGGKDNHSRLEKDCPKSAHFLKFTVDFTEAPQVFEGYIYTHEENAMAGLTWWRGMTFGWSAVRKSCANTLFNHAPEGMVCYQNKRLQKQLGDCDAVDQICANVEMDYPLVTHASSVSVKSRINANIMQEMIGDISSLEVYVDEFLFQWDFEVANNATDLGWTEETHTEVILNRDVVFSTRKSTYRYTGGAHGLGTEKYTSYGTDGYELMLEQIVYPEKITELTQLAEGVFRQHYGIAPHGHLEDAGFSFEHNRFALSHNFGLSENGLVFHYNPYEIAPYALGPTTLLLPYHEIKHLLLPCYAQLGRWRISAGQVGPVRSGMTVVDIQSLIPFTRYAVVQGAEAEFTEMMFCDCSTVSLYLNDARPATVETARVFSKNFETDAGVQVGMLLSDAEAIYGGIREIIRSEIELREVVTFNRHPAGVQVELESDAGVFSGSSNTTITYQPDAVIKAFWVSF